jgi:hypothetical protein
MKRFASKLKPGTDAVMGIERTFLVSLFEALDSFLMMSCAMVMVRSWCTNLLSLTTLYDCHTKAVSAPLCSMCRVAGRNLLGAGVLHFDLTLGQPQR